MASVQELQAVFEVEEDEASAPGIANHPNSPITYRMNREKKVSLRGIRYIYRFFQGTTCLLSAKSKGKHPSHFIAIQASDNAHLSQKDPVAALIPFDSCRKFSLKQKDELLDIEFEYRKAARREPRTMCIIIYDQKYKHLSPIRSILPKCAGNGVWELDLDDRFAIGSTKNAVLFCGETKERCMIVRKVTKSDIEFDVFVPLPPLYVMAVALGSFIGQLE